LFSPPGLVVFQSDWLDVAYYVITEYSIEAIKVYFKDAIIGNTDGGLKCLENPTPSFVITQSYYFVNDAFLHRRLGSRIDPVLVLLSIGDERDAVTLRWSAWLIVP
jgi:hypothetical protein